jgi:hypothetical protein
MQELTLFLYKRLFKRAKIVYIVPIRKGGAFTMDYAKESLRLHGEWKGKIEVVATVPVSTKDDLSLA